MKDFKNIHSWFIGWSRDRFGNVSRYNLKPICNTITQFAGRPYAKDPRTNMANTTPYVLIEYADKD